MYRGVTTQAPKERIYSYRRSRATIGVGRVRNRWSALLCCAPHTTGRAVVFRTGMPAGGLGQNQHFLGDFVPLYHSQKERIFNFSAQRTPNGPESAREQPPSTLRLYGRHTMRLERRHGGVCPMCWSSPFFHSTRAAPPQSPEPANTRVVRAVDATFK